MIMRDIEDWQARVLVENWAQSVERHQRCMFEDTVRFVEVLKQRKLTARTKNDIAIVIKGLQATVKSISKGVGNVLAIKNGVH